MAFDWNSVGAGPAGDALELSFFGPGFGECIVIHIGAGRWMIIDSCVDTSDSSRVPVAERYLRTIGVRLEDQVDLIVATHWHADHIRGIGRLTEVCRAAKFSCGLAMLGVEFQIYLEEMATASAATNGAKLADFREAIRHQLDRDVPIRWAGANKLLHSWPSVVDPAQTKNFVRSLSPSNAEYQLFLQGVDAVRPQPLFAKKAAVANSPNLASIALHLQTEFSSVILGADLETHHNPARGWTAAIGEAAMAALPKGEILKVPHHGSITGFHPQIWSDLLEPRPISVVTPFNRLRDEHKLPTADEVHRLSNLSSSLFATAPTKSVKTAGREPAVERSLRESNIVIRSAEVPLGMVRLRKVRDAAWSTEVFQPAAQLHP